MTGLIFWKAESKQAINSYDDSECNSRMLGEGSYRKSIFLFIQECILSVLSAENLFQYKHKGNRKSIFLRIQECILSVLSAENLFQYKHLHENLNWTAVREM